MKTEMDIKQSVKADLQKIFDEDTLNQYLDAIHFHYGDGRYEPGLYVYAEKESFVYLVVGDRGGIDQKIVSDNLSEILYRIYTNITYTEATRLAMAHAEKGKDWRRWLFSFQLELLQKINVDCYVRRNQEIQAILLSSPYHDA